MAFHHGQTPLSLGQLPSITWSGARRPSGGAGRRTSSRSSRSLSAARPESASIAQWRPNRRIFEDAASDRASNLRSAAQVCTAIRSTIVLSLAARPLADHFSPSPIVGSRGSAAPALIPTIRAGRLVHAFTWSGSHGAEPSSRIGRGGFDYHGRACLRPET
jgi:hypothetical protein